MLLLHSFEYHLYFYHHNQIFVDQLRTLDHAFLKHHHRLDRFDDNGAGKFL